MEDSSPLTFKSVCAYALPAFSLAVIGIPIYIYIPKFYTDVIKVPIGIVGYILLAARIFDAITDPAVGYISDHTHTMFGRRRPYMAVGSLFLSLTLYLLLNPLRGNQFFQIIWFGALIFLLFLCWTIVVVPYESLGPEITFDYDQRSFLFGLRDGFLIAGTLAAASSPAIIRWLYALPLTPAGEKKKFFIMSLAYIPLLILTCWWCILVIRERKRVRQKRESPFASFRSVKRNRPFLVLLAAFTVSSIGSNLPAALILYYVQYILKSDKADYFLLEYFMVGILFLPLWIYLARRIGKKTTWLITMAINTGAFIGVFFLGAGDVLLYGVLVFFSGIGFGATIALPSVIQADVIDYDELYSGHRKEGQYVGIWSIFKKMAAALGVGISLVILGLLEYQPNASQSPQVLLALRTMYALVPCICNIVAFFIAWKYPINSEVHKRILRAINEKREGGTVYDPLHPEIKVS
jgi:glycoside/pentoside/hexuronide:cation symporter, GPH family